jgi:hypothetical protein
MKTYTREEMAFFAYFVDCAKIPHGNAIDWAYEQFSNDSIPEWIEKISIEADSRGIVEILTSEFRLNENEFRIKYIIGEISKLADLKILELSDIPGFLTIFGFEQLKPVGDKEITHVLWEIVNANANNALAKCFWDEIELNFSVQLNRCDEYGICSYKGYISS